MDLCLANLKGHKFYSAFLVVIWVYFNTDTHRLKTDHPILLDCFIMKAQENGSIKIHLCIEDMKFMAVFNC